jgi:uncharacterized membrane protein YeaQ/YmgE (transglycosylase-associated protein family)
MSGVGLIGTIIVGALAGWLASRFTGTGTGLLANIALGIVGAMVFALLGGFIGISAHGWIGNLIGGTIGAVVLIAAYRALKKT